MKVADVTIGVSAATLDAVAMLLHTRLGQSFVPRSSSFLGGDYYFASTRDREEVLIHWNRDGDDVAEVEYAEFNVLVQINGCPNVGEWNWLLEEFGSVIIRVNPYEVDD